MKIILELKHCDGFCLEQLLSEVTIRREQEEHWTGRRVRTQQMNVLGRIVGKRASRTITSRLQEISK